MKTIENGILKIEKIKSDKLLTRIGSSFQAFECHRWHVKKTKSLIPLAKSKDGIEVVKHPKKLIYGVQFHPEMSVDKTAGRKIIENFLNLTV